MKGFVLLITILVLLTAATGVLCWSFKSSILANSLEKHLKVPVRISNLELTRSSISIHNIFIGSLQKARNPLSFNCQHIEIETDTTKLLKDPLTIQSLEMDNLTIGLEYFSDGSTNWSEILSSTSQEPSSDSFVIHNLTLKNITVIVTKANGAVTKYPTIPLITLKDVSSANEPISEIEKMIFKIILNNVMQKFNLLINPQRSPILSPLQSFPSL